MNKRAEFIILCLSFLLIPALLCVIYFTKGAIFPYIETSPKQTWNIQYIPVVITSLVGLMIAYFGIKRRIYKKSYIISILWNIFWLVNSGFAVIYLWGEKV